MSQFFVVDCPGWAFLTFSVYNDESLKTNAGIGDFREDGIVGTNGDAPAESGVEGSSSRTPLTHSIDEIEPLNADALISH